eukprot:9232475-Alexandrium_andersonii.AAC.1
MQIWTSEALCEARRLRRQALKLEGLQLSPIPGRGGGRSARWACCDSGVLGPGLGPTSYLCPE